MTRETDLENYLTRSVEHIFRDVVRATIHNPSESLFLTRFAATVKRANRVRNRLEKSGEHIPPFLIAGITSSCNLHCAGCYARANHSCSDCHPTEQLSAAEWQRIFSEASSLGILFILLAGGEPMLRKDVLQVAAGIEEVLFPIFTNGTLIDADTVETLDRHRNLIPVLSIEGEPETTDRRRGRGVSHTLLHTMSQMHSRGILFAVSITVTRENLHEVTADSFVDGLQKQGCRAILYVEFVPTDSRNTSLALTPAERDSLMRRMQQLRAEDREMVFIAFPGDEKSSGGCLAAGRGFFYINPHGGAEPCPFSPYSDVNVRDSSLLDALHSKLFSDLQGGSILLDDHSGGCVLYEKRAQVEALLKQSR